MLNNTNIFFTVDDNRGGACSGEVRVGVPLSSSQETAVDDGAIYDATSP